MKLAIKIIVVLGSILLLCGCAGKNFVRPESETLKNGQTTYATIISLYGTPYRDGSVVKNDKMLKTASYAYSVFKGSAHHDGAMAVRSMAFYFLDDTLVGYEFLSSWADDHTDFDENKIKEIVKGKTARAEVIQLLGKPGGYYIYPLIKSNQGEAAVYAYLETRGSAFSLKQYSKVLVVSFDTSEIVTDVEFSSVGSKQD